ncbi:MAG: hypothetical protein K6A36_06375, partial [Paludibacteraceae bacterium]|nr:hypothetical protein [Paludibacteraceae bacterium]
MYYLDYESVSSFGPFYGTKQRLDTLHSPEEATINGRMYADNYMKVELVVFDNRSFRCMPYIPTGLIEIPYTIDRGILHEVEVLYPDNILEEKYSYKCKMLFLQTEDDDFPLYYEDLSDEWRERLDTLHTPVAATIWGFDGGYVRSISF